MTRLLHVLTLLTAAALALPAMAKDDPLSLVPADAVAVGAVRLADMRSSPLSSLLLQHVDRMSTDGEAEGFLREAGLRPLQDVDRLVVATSPRTALGSKPDMLVIAEGRFEPERLATALISRGAVRKGAYIVFPEAGRDSDGETGAVAFVSPSLAIAGNERSVINALSARESGGTGFASRGALAGDLVRLEPDATAWALIDVTRAARLTKGGSIETGNGQPGAALQAALKSVSTVAIWAKDTGEALQVGGTALSNDAETLKLLEDSLRGSLAAMRLAVQDKSPEMVSVLRRFDVERKSDSIRVEGTIPAASIRQLMAKTLAVAKN